MTWWWSKFSRKEFLIELMIIFQWNMGKFIPWRRCWEMEPPCISKASLFKSTSSIATSHRSGVPTVIFRRKNRRDPVAHCRQSAKQRVHRWSPHQVRLIAELQNVQRGNGIACGGSGGSAKNGAAAVEGGCGRANVQRQRGKSAPFGRAVGQLCAGQWDFAPFGGQVFAARSGDHRQHAKWGTRFFRDF